MVYDEWIPIYQGLCRDYRIAVLEDQQRLWFTSLHLYSAADIRTAARRALETLKWMPALSELIDFIPVKRKKADDWEDWSATKPLDTKYDCSHLTDEQILDALQRFSGCAWDVDQGRLPLNLVRSGNRVFCQSVHDGLKV